MVKQYKNVSEDRWLRFPDGQEVGPGQTFQRDYDPNQEWQHKVGGFVEELPAVTSEPADESDEEEGEVDG